MTTENISRSISVKELPDQQVSDLHLTDHLSEVHPDQRLSQQDLSKKYEYFSYFSTKTYEVGPLVGTHQKHLTEALLMSTHKMFMCRNKKNMWIPLLIWSRFVPEKLETQLPNLP